jgi:hypothetical protein
MVDSAIYFWLFRQFVKSDNLSADYSETENLSGRLRFPAMDLEASVDDKFDLLIECPYLAGT